MRKTEAPPNKATHQSKHGMVATASGPATAAGVAVLENGGNAFDAACAVSFALGVSEPQASGMGGQSTGLIYHAKEKRYFSLDGSSFAPYGFQPHRMPAVPFKEGLSASTLPSTVAFYGYLSEAYGRLPFKDVIAPAVSLAKEGVPVTPLIHSLLQKHRSRLIKDPLIERVFFENGEPLPENRLFKQPELGRTMRRLADNGWRDFYTGETGRMIVRDMTERGGLLREEDFAQIPVPVERPVLSGHYRGYGIHTFPPPGAGRVLIQILNILEQFSPQEIDPDTETGAFLLALAFQLTLRDRKRMPQNPDIYFQKIEEKMADKAHAKRVRATIAHIMSDYHRTTGHSAPKTGGETTHFCVADKDGNIVAVTQSIELVFGAKRIARDLGFFYNNYMGAFDYKDRTHPYYLLPGNRPWSSAAPTIITYRNRPRLVLGSPGSARISTALTQVLIRYIDGNRPIEQAIAAPRFHTSDKKKLQIEYDRFDKQTIDTLSAVGFDIKKRKPYSFYLGCVQAIELPHNKNNRYFKGAADPRRDGTAGGPQKP